MLERFFNPQSIAIIGASHSPDKLGNVITHNLLTHRYRGKVYPVNPKGGTLYGRTMYRSVGDIPHPVDMAVIVIPAAGVQQAVADCGRAGIRAAIVISAGFSEQDRAGAQLERNVLRTAQKYNVRILGPNCLGLIVPSMRMNASFAAGLPARGGVAVISQSGAMAVSITEWALATQLGFSALVSLGNKADVQEEELLKYFGNDRQTTVIIMYLESLSTGRSFLRRLKRVTQQKPVVILKPGKSEQAQAAVASHTGAIAGAYAVQHAFLRAAGAVVVDSLEELFLYTKLFQEPYRLAGDRIAIVTNAGGPGILATDAVAASPYMRLAELSPQTTAHLRATLPQAAAIGNPIDVVGDATPVRYRTALRAALSDKQVDGVVALLTHQYVTDTQAIARLIVEEQKRHPRKPIAVAFIGGSGVMTGRALLTEKHILQFEYPEQAVTALGILRQYDLNRAQPRTFPEVAPAVSGRLRPMLGVAAEHILKRSVPYFLPSVVVRTADEAVRRARKLGYPLVAKIISHQLIHKTEAAAVHVNIPDDGALRGIIDNWRRRIPIRFKPGEGYLLQPYRPGPVEVFVGAKRDDQLGPYAVVGLGGIFVEAIGGQVIIPLPCTSGQAESAIAQGTLGRILGSARGRRIDPRPLTEIILGLSAVMTKKPAITECDLNPVILSDTGTAIVDSRLIVTR
ncbi:MAG: acetate--CoA ligase family protein [Patescibacteria group bacterium]